MENDKGKVYGQQFEKLLISSFSFLSERNRRKNGKLKQNNFKDPKKRPKNVTNLNMYISKTNNINDQSGHLSEQNEYPDENPLLS